MGERGDAANSATQAPESVSKLDPADAFALLGDATRLAIVTALHEASDEAPIPFSDLSHLVEADDTGRFNYHLDKLIPHFVSRTDEGYDLTFAGERLARAVAAGTFTDSPRLEPFEMDGACYACGAVALQGAYEDEQFTIECRDCGESVLRFPVLPSIVRGRDPDAFVAVFDRWSRAQVEQVRRGFCSNCGGTVKPDVVEPKYDTIEFDVVARFTCTVCGLQPMTSFGSLALQEPVVETFHRRRGTDLQNRPYWEIPQCVAGEGVDVVSRDPWRIRVSFFAADDACHVVFDGDLSVVEAKIVPGDSPDGA